MIPETKLRLVKQPSGEEIPFPTNSGTFIDVDVSPIGEANQLARDVNGNLVDLGDPRFRKYAVSLSCSGNVQLPGLTNIWPGMDFQIELPVTLREPGATPSRTAVAGSERIVGGYVEYRPAMTVKLTRNSLQETEWRGRTSGWSLSFEEVDAVFEDGPGLPEELVEATGGIVTDYTDADGAKWREHDFLSTDFFDVSAAGEVEAWLIGAGGGGGLARGGGGAGGVMPLKLRVEVGLVAVAIGAGGPVGNGTGYSRHGRPGNETLLGGISVPGGGGGSGSDGSSTPPKDGASGGGANFAGDPGGTGLALLGHRGGDNSTTDNCGGGGGGAGGPGEDVRAPQDPGDGGPGIEVPHSSGSLSVSGGGAGGDYDSVRLAQGTHGGGSAAIGLVDGQPNTGSGGAGSGRNASIGTNFPPGNGGSGRVIIRYRIA